MRVPSSHQLEYFQLVARLQHMSRAAREAGVSQPALSRAISKLEADLGVSLFERSGRSVKLTKCGELFKKRVDRALSEIYDGCLELANLSSVKQDTVTIAFQSTLSVRYLPELVRQFVELYPNIRFSLVNRFGKGFDQMLIDGQADLAFVRPLTHPEIEWRFLMDQELVLIVPRSHRLAREQQVSLCELKDEKFVSLTKASGFRKIIEDFCALQGFRPQYNFESDNLMSVSGFVSCGFGVALVPPECARVADDVATLRVVKPVPRRLIGLARLKSRTLSESKRLFFNFVFDQQASTSAAAE
jgi:DNA-binding transcriptional LysR family regulator